jgi:hypothetical protein
MEDLVEIYAFFLKRTVTARAAGFRLYCHGAHSSPEYTGMARNAGSWAGFANQ